MDLDELTTIVGNEITSAVGYHNDNFESDRIKSMEYYFGHPFGDEREGFSQVVSTDLSDAIEFIMPSLMRIFTESDDYVEAKPVDMDDVPFAKEATQYCNWVITDDNEGFELVHNFFKDALLYRLGCIKTHLGEEVTTNEVVHERINYSALVQIEDNPDAEILEQETTFDPAIGDFVFSLRVRYTTRRERIDLENVPPEEFLMSARAKSIEDARMVGHRTKKTISDLVAMGYDEDEIREHGGSGDPYDDEEEVLRHQNMDGGNPDGSDDDTLDEVEVVEVFMRVDFDGDGIAERRRILSIGPGYHILENDPYDCVPFAIVSPILVPHRAVGRSISELMYSVQLIKSQLLRQMLDNMYRMNNSRLGYVEGQVNQDDILRNAPGSPIRMRAPGMIQEIKPQGLTNDALAAISYIDHVKEERTGVSKAAQGLDADRLQSTAAVGIEATVSAAQSKIEMIARVLAETGMKRLFKMILHMASKLRNPPQMIRLRKEFITLNPDRWQNEYQMTVNVGLGTGQTREKIAALQAIAAKQEQILMTAGMENPLVTLPQYAMTLKKTVELAGWKDTQSFFNLPEQVMQMQQAMAERAAQQPPPPDPKMLEAQNDMQIKQQKAAAEIALDKEKAAAQMQIEREKAAAEIQTKSNPDLSVDLRKMAMDAQQKQLDRDHDMKKHILTMAASGNSPDPQEVESEVGPAMNQIAEVLNKLAAPRRVLRDDQGNIIGSEAIS